MAPLLNSPGVVLLSSFALLLAAALAGSAFRRRRRDEIDKDEFNLVISATLTLLGLIIGFSFSMAVSRYDSRKTLEEEEANAIGTEYARAELLPAASARRVQGLLQDYLGQRILFFTAPSENRLEENNVATARLQGDLWSAVRSHAQANKTPIDAVVVTGMNDVLNSQGYTQAAFWNRIPPPAWLLMLLISIAASFLVGFNADPKRVGFVQFVVLPLTTATAFFLIADMDSPRGGLVRVVPQNLMSLEASLSKP